MTFYLAIFEFLGTTEMLVIAVVALIVFGPRKLPEVGRSIGKTLSEFKRASDDFKRTWEREVEMERIERDLNVDADVTLNLKPTPAATHSRDVSTGNGGGEKPASESFEEERRIGRSSAFSFESGAAAARPSSEERAEIENAGRESESSEPPRKHDWL